MHQYRPALPRLIAADRMSIHHNTMLENGPALGVRIRGVPRDLAEIYGNWFSEADAALAVGQLEPPGNVWVYDNLYGPEKTLVQVGPQSTPRIRFRQPPPPTERPVKLDDALRLDIEVTVPDGLHLQSVEIRLDDRQIYSGPTSPPAGELTVDPSALTSGEHELLATAVDDRGGTATQSVALLVEN
jgi:hypothetical protein